MAQRWKQVKVKTHWGFCQLFWVDIFSVGNVLLSLGVELSKSCCCCCWAQALQVESVMWHFFSFHTSNLEFTVSKKNSLQHVLITCVLVTTRSPCLSIRCSVLLKCFIEVVYGVCKFATQPRCQEMLIPGFPTCTLVLSVQRGVAVMGEDSF